MRKTEPEVIKLLLTKYEAIQNSQHYQLCYHLYLRPILVLLIIIIF